MMTEAMLTTEAILDAFATANGVLPRTALRQAATRWQEVGPTLLALLQAHADGIGRSERTEAILFFGIYLMAQVRETRAFPLLCAIAADGQRLRRLIEDGLTEDLPGILARVYDGDPAPLLMLIETTNADEYARDAALETLAWLTAAGRIDQKETARYLRDLFTTLLPQSECYVWVGWQQAIALLGLGELECLVEKAFRRGWIDESVMGLHHFQDDLRAAQEAATPMTVFSSRIRDMARYDDAVALLFTWHSFRPKEEQKQRSVAAAARLRGDQPIGNPLRNVGRNDPCPCGSGKKFKKCCLGKTASAR
jgi:hypothetical protein